MSTGERILQKGKISRTGSYHAWGQLVAEEVIEFGQACQGGTDPELQAKVYAGGTFIGVAQYDATKGYSTRDGSGNPSVVRKYLQYDTMVVVRKGTVVVEVKEAVSALDPVYVDAATGYFYKQAGGGRTLVARAQFASDSQTADSLTLAELELDLP